MSNALNAAMALRSMQGICTSPHMGSHVKPRLCSIAISAAYSICCGLPPNSWLAATAAITQALPTSPWQPTSAPEMEALCLMTLANRPAVAMARSISLSENSCAFFRW